MQPETIGVTITFKLPVTFHLRLITLDEENQLRQKMFGLTEAEQAEKSYQHNVDFLADYSEVLPEGMYGDAIPKCPIPEAVRQYFSEKSVIKERTAEYAVRAYFSKLTPDISFL